MLTVEQLSRRPVTFRLLTGVWERRRDNFEYGGRPHSLCDLVNHLLVGLGQIITDYNGFWGVANLYDYKRSRSHAKHGNESLPQIRYN
jgi:hypothetical protein